MQVQSGLMVWGLMDDVPAKRNDSGFLPTRVRLAPARNIPTAKHPPEVSTNALETYPAFLVLCFITTPRGLRHRRHRDALGKLYDALIYLEDNGREVSECIISLLRSHVRSKGHDFVEQRPSQSAQVGAKRSTSCRAWPLTWSNRRRIPSALGQLVGSMDVPG
jgi:hypothetical protein